MVSKGCAEVSATLFTISELATTSNYARRTVEVVSAEFVVLTDEDGNDLTFEENGEVYYVCQVWYTLGKVLETANINE